MPRPPTDRPPARSPRALAAAALLVAASAARAAAPAPVLALPTDPALRTLLDAAIAARPELRAADARLRAERARVPQAGALADPVLSLGIQNDGFSRIQIGEMETSYYSVMLSQSLPWPGKLALRAEAAEAGVRGVDADLARARLALEAEVRRAYVDLVLARDRLGLLARLEGLWERSETLARSRYVAGEGAQSDLLRAQLERTRLRQRRIVLEAEARTRSQAVNRLRGAPLDAEVETGTTILAMPLPALPGEEALLGDAEARSPELARARAAAARGETAAALAARERFPDVTLSAGIMPRPPLDPMWTATVAVPIPVFTARKQGRAAEEARARAEADRADAAALADVLRERVAARRAALAAALDVVAGYRGGLLVQSQATVDATLAQYRVGRVTFASVLEALAGLVSDEDGLLAAGADAQRLAIATFEVSLDPAGAPGAGAMGGTAIPGAGSVRTAASGGRAGASSSPSDAAAPSSAMGGGM